MTIKDINDYIKARNSLINLVNTIDKHAKILYTKYGECKLVYACFIARKSTMKQIQGIEDVLDSVYPQWRGRTLSDRSLAAHRQFEEEAHRRTVDQFNEISRRACEDATRIAQETSLNAMQQCMADSMAASMNAIQQMNAVPPAATNPFGF